MWILALALSFATPVFATTVEPFSQDRLLREAPLIVHGVVVQIETGRGGRRSARLEAREVLRAPDGFRGLSEFRLPLRNHVSPDGRMAYRVGLAPDFKVGEEVVAFLVPRGQAGDVAAGFDLLGFHQGKFRVVSDATGVRRVRSWDQAPEAPLSDEELAAQRRGTARFQTKSSSLQLPLVGGGEAQQLMTLDELLNRARLSP